jgi:hypothetical protein
MQAIQTLNDGSRLEVVVNKYADRVLILITQLGKVGNLVCDPIGLASLTYDH